MSSDMVLLEVPSVNHIDNILTSVDVVAPGGEAAFSPSDISNGIGWWDASDAATITEFTNLVDLWEDKFGNGNDFKQAINTNRPTTNTETINSLNALGFNGSDNFMRFVGDTFAGGALTQPTTIYFVAETFDINLATSTYFFDGEVSGLNRHTFFTDATANGLRIFSGTTITDADGNNDGVHLFKIVFNTTSSELFVDGVSVLSGDTGTDTWGGITLASRFNGQSYGDFHLGEMIIYNKLVTGQEDTDVTDYLNTKWGL